MFLWKSSIDKRFISEQFKEDTNAIGICHPDEITTPVLQGSTMVCNGEIFTVSGSEDVAGQDKVYAVYLKL